MSNRTAEGVARENSTFVPDTDGRGANATATCFHFTLFTLWSTWVVTVDAYSMAASPRLNDNVTQAQPHSKKLP